MGSRPRQVAGQSACRDGLQPGYFASCSAAAGHSSTPCQG